MLACCTIHEGSRLAFATVIVSHLVVQIIKRTVVRGRPATTGRVVGQLIAALTAVVLSGLPLQFP
jgi:hypothetical protein